MRNYEVASTRHHTDMGKMPDDLSSLPIFGGPKTPQDPDNDCGDAIGAADSSDESDAPGAEDFGDENHAALMKEGL